MRFVAATWLWALLLVPVLMLLVRVDEARRRKRLARFAGESLWSSLAPEVDFSARSRKAYLWIASFAFFILALARPQWGTREEVAKTDGLDVMITLDVSNSMEVEDVVPSRLKKAKHLIRGLVDRLAGDRVGLVVFAGGGSVACPLTTDLEYVLENLQIQTPKMIPSQGTDIGIGLDTAYRALQRGAENSPQAGSTPQAGTPPSAAIVLVTDGEDHEGGANEAVAKLRAAGVKLYILGVGTQKGGPVPVRDDNGNLQGYKRDRSGQSIVSSFNADSLVQLAASAGGRYWSVTPDEGEIDSLLKDLGAMNRGEFGEHHYIVYEERFQYPLAIAIILLLLEISLPGKRLVTGRRRTTAAMVGLVALSGMVLSAGNASAAGLDTYLENEKGIEAFKKGKLDEAKQKFSAAQARDPQSPELLYNQGLVQLQNGETDSAIQGFRDSARGAMEKGDPSLTSRSFFNLGSALAKKGDTPGATRAYLSAINAAQSAKDSKLEEDARKNLELLAQQQQQQKQQQKQQQQQQNQNQKQNQDQNQQNQNQQQQQQQQQNQQGQGQDKKQDQNGKDSKDQKDQNGKNGQDQQNQQDQQQNGEGDQNQQQQDKRYEAGSGSRRKNFKSQKMTEEDAERVMAELKSREQDLQNRLKKQNGNRGGGNGKDW